MQELILLVFVPQSPPLLQFALGMHHMGKQSCKKVKKLKKGV